MPKYLSFKGPWAVFLNPSESQFAHQKNGITVIPTECVAVYVWTKVMQVFLCLGCLLSVISHALPLLGSVWRGQQPAFPSSSISCLPSGSGQWEALLGDGRVGRREKRGYSSSLLLWVKSPEQLLLLLGTCFLQACPPWPGFSK